MPSDSTPALWPFALHAYALPGVAGTCLRLQDEHGLDVDVLLAVLWQARRGTALDEATLGRMLAAVAPVQPRMRELRALRKAVGSDRAQEPRWQETYEHLKAAELAAERVALSLLEASSIQGRAVDPALLDTAPTQDDVAAEAEAEDAPPSDAAGLALAALQRLAVRCGASSCEPLLQALVDTVLPRSSAARD